MTLEGLTEILERNESGPSFFKVIGEVWEATPLTGPQQKSFVLVFEIFLCDQKAGIEELNLGISCCFGRHSKQDTHWSGRQMEPVNPVLSAVQQIFSICHFIQYVIPKISI